MNRTFRRTLVSLTAAASALAATTIAPRPAAAQEALTYDLTMNVLGAVMGQGLGFVWSSDSTLSAQSDAVIASYIETISANIANAEKATAESQLQTAIDDAKGWNVAYGTSTCDALGGNVTTLGTYKSDADTAMSTFAGLGLAGAQGYMVASSLKVTFLKELYQVQMAQNVCPGSTVPNNWGDPLETALKDVSTTAATAVAQLSTFETKFEASFPTSVYLAAPSSQTNTCKDECGNVTLCEISMGEGDAGNAYVGSSVYCAEYKDVTGATQKTCGTVTVPSYSCGGGFGTWKVQDNSTAQGLEAQANGYVALQATKMAQRDAVLGTGFYETYAALQKVANGDFEYCGNDSCAIGEVTWCSQDCSSSDYASISQSSLGTLSLPASNYTVLSSGGYNLVWQTDGNLVLTDASDAIVWETETSGTGRSLSFGSDGNLVVYNGSGSKLWRSSTGSLANPVETLVLLNGELSLLDSFGIEQWSSSTDIYNYDELSTFGNDSGRFCLPTLPSSFPVMANARYKLTWSSTGDLQVQNIFGTSTIWHTSTAGSYLCNQESGDLAIYDASGNVLWSTGTGGLTSGSGTFTLSGAIASSMAPNSSLASTTDGWGGTLALVGSQLRLLSAAGEPLWTSTSCADGWGCDTDGQVASMAVLVFDNCWTVGSSTQTLLSNEYAELDFGTDGNLSLYDKTPQFFNPGVSYHSSNDTVPEAAYLTWGSSQSIWSSGTSGTGHSVCLKSTGGFVVKNSSGTTIWATSTGGYAADLVLAGCNVAMVDSTGKAVASSNTTCAYYDRNQTSFFASSASL